MLEDYNKLTLFQKYKDDQDILVEEDYFLRDPSIMHLKLLLLEKGGFLHDIIK